MNGSEYPAITQLDGLGNTTSAVDVPLLKEQQPIFCVLVTTQAVVGMYLLVAMIYSEWKHRAPSTTSQMHAKWLRRVCLIVAVIGTVHLVVNEIAVITPPSEKSCSLRLAIQKVTYCSGMFSVYGFLWLRQKLFYSNPSLKYLYTPWLRRFSWAVLAIIIVCFVCQCVMSVLGILFSEQQELVADSEICFNPHKELWNIQITLAALSSSMVHVALMSLFLYPLCKHDVQNSSYFVRAQNGSFVSRSSLQAQHQEEGSPRRNLTRSIVRGSLRRIYENDNGSPSEVGSPLNTSRGSRTESETKKKPKSNVANRLKRLIKRCLTLTAICVIASLAVTIITVAFYHGGLLATFLYGTNMLINMICCTGCFNHWLGTLFPFCITPKKRESSSSRKVPSETSRLARKFDSIV